MREELRAFIIILILFLIIFVEMCNDYEDKKLYEEEKIEKDSCKIEKIAILKY